MRKVCLTRTFTHAVVVTGNMKTVYVGGQNLQIALAAAGAILAHVVKWNIYVVQGQPLQPGFEAFQRVWGNRPYPPAITVALVAALAHPRIPGRGRRDRCSATIATRAPAPPGNGPIPPSQRARRGVARTEPRASVGNSAAGSDDEGGYMTESGPSNRPHRAVYVPPSPAAQDIITCTLRTTSGQMSRCLVLQHGKA